MCQFTASSFFIGMTFVAVMCGFNNVGVGEDKPGTYQGVRVTAHELAHA